MPIRLYEAYINIRLKLLYILDTISIYMDTLRQDEQTMLIICKYLLKP